jgi:hypothetical protein
LIRPPTISTDPAVKRKVFQGMVERVTTDDAYRAEMTKSYSLLMRRKLDKDLPSVNTGGNPWRGTRPGLDHPLGVFSYEKSLGEGPAPRARPQTAPVGSSSRFVRSRSALLPGTRWAGPESWLEGPWKDCGPTGGLNDPFPRVRAPSLRRAQSAPPARRY